MKLKYYLRGLAVGILVTTVVLMIAGKGHGTTMTDDEVIARAKQLGMVMEDSKTGDKEDLFSGKDNQKEDTESTQSTEKQEQKTENKNDSKPSDESKQETTGSSRMLPHRISSRMQMPDRIRIPSRMQIPRSRVPRTVRMHRLRRSPSMWK